MRQLITSADGPYPQARNAMPGVARRSSKAGTSPDLALARTLHAPLTSLPASEAGDRARAAVTLTAASVLEWKVRHGAFPVTLAQAMPRVPQDPFDLRPIRYRREGNGFVVWSVGVSGRFGGGRRGTRYPSSEVLFRYPAPPSAVP
jgi:hypothetical protein